MPKDHRPEGESVYIKKTMSAHVITNICHLVAGHTEPCV